jgi:hypothetical protein
MINILLKKLFMGERIDYILNYAMIIVKLVMYLDYQIIIKNALLVYLNIPLII